MKHVRFSFQPVFAYAVLAGMFACSSAPPSAPIADAGPVLPEKADANELDSGTDAYLDGGNRIDGGNRSDAAEDGAVPDDAGTAEGGPSVSVGGGHLCFLTPGGGVKCWGKNDSGQLGDGSTKERFTTGPIDVSGLAGGAISLSAGGSHSCALTSQGGVKCWGGNGAGQLGNGTLVPSSTPIDVPGLTSGVVAISAGGAHTCAIVGSVRALKCWGSNEHGAIGDGTGLPRLSPVDVPGLTSDVAAVSAGGLNTCTLATNGSVKCWGNNIFGQVGNATSGQPVFAPASVSGLASGVAAISAGGGRTCALTTGGAVWCWGQDRTWVPTEVSGLPSGISAIAVGSYHACARASAGGVKCWGSNRAGELGDGTKIDSLLVPVQVSGLGASVSVVAAGAFRTCARSGLTDLKCWGTTLGSLPVGLP